MRQVDVTGTPKRKDCLPTVAVRAVLRIGFLIPAGYLFDIKKLVGPIEELKTGSVNGCRGYLDAAESY
jgi:hypothetical protein